MKEGIDFYYDGIRSRDMGIFNVELNSGLFNEPFIAAREIKEIEIRGNDKPYFQGVKRSPLSFKLSFAFDGSYNEARIREVARWLDQDFYKPFYTTDNTERIFYCMLNSSSELLHNGLKQGYITLEMRCDSPFSYSPQFTSRTYFWDEAPITVTEKNVDSSFSVGSLDNLVVDGTSKNLKLDATKKKWSDVPTSTWNDL
jgi:phage-related protein